MSYMGIWGIAGTFPQVLAPGIGGVLLDAFNRAGHKRGYQVVFATVVFYLAVGTVMLIRVVEPKPRETLLGLLPEADGGTMAGG